MSKGKVVVGISGGVDSAVAAYLLKEDGYDVIGVTLNLSQNDEDYLLREGGCCSLSSVLDARRIAEIIDIPFYVLNFKDIFKLKVVDYFVDEYIKGRTPNPCVACNKHIKFSGFLDIAKKLGAKYIATGHYARVEEVDGRYLLKLADDYRKDQTYMLYNFTQEQLKYTLMPCGNYTKPEIRKIAEDIGLHVHNKKDSEEICFIPDNNHGEFINSIIEVKKGNFVDKFGNVLGEHKGIVYYTIGQRKGLGIAFGKKVFVTGINYEKNEVIIGDEEDLYRDSLVASNLNFIMFDKLIDKMEVKCKIRYKSDFSDAEIEMIDSDKIKVNFKEKQKIADCFSSINVKYASSKLVFPLAKIASSIVP